MKKLIRSMLGENFFYNNIGEIREAVSNCKTFLDLGCGNSSPYLRYLHDNGTHKAVGVDLYAEVSSDYDEIVRKDVLGFISSAPDKSFDAVMGFDIVEHFNKPDAIKLIEQMQRVARKVDVIVTPNGFWPGMIEGPGMEHLCGISSEEFDKSGFRTWGSDGLGILRSKKHSYLKGFRSHVTLPFQMLIFNFSQLIAKNNPSLAYGLCAIKTIGDEK